MKEFKLETDTNTVYIKVIRFIGVFGMGIFVGATLIELKNDLPIEWLSLLSGFLPALALSMFSGFGKNQSIIVNEDGIFTKSYAFLHEEQTNIKWDKIRSIHIDNGHIFSPSKILIKKNIGSTEKIPIPIYTKEQIQGLKEYLKEVTEFRKIEYIRV